LGKVLQMIRNITLLALSLLICSGAIAGQAKHKKKKAATGNILSVEMRRTACFGRCPDYSIEVAANGKATYSARVFNADTGIFTKQIGTKKAMSYISKFNAIRIDTFRDLYQSRMQDVPGFVYTIRFRDSTKVIRNANFGPVILKKLANDMDGLVGKKVDGTWKKQTGKAK
jgi:Domain of unknown function (DUF6438)